jgi:hypothetical protein
MKNTAHNMTNIKIQLDQKTAQQLKLTGDEIFHVSLDGRQLILDRNMPLRHQDQKLGLRFTGIAGMMASLMALFLFRWQDISLVSMTGAYSITQLTIVLGMIFGSVAFGWTMYRMRQSRRFSVRLFHAVTISIAYMILGFVGLVLFMRLWQSAFASVQLDGYTAAIVIGTLVAVMSYVMILSGLALGFNTIITVLMLTLGGGVILSMVTNGHADWWQYNFSYLGTDLVPNSWIFNVTLIFSALILLALLDYLFSWLGARYSENRSLFYLRVLLTLTAITLAGVGAVPNNDGWMHIVHNHLAQMLVVWILLMIGAIRWLLPQAGSEFLLMSYSIAGGLVAVEILFEGLHYLSLTAFELIAFGLAFTWLILLLQVLRQTSWQHEAKILATLVVNDKHRGT